MYTPLYVKSNYSFLQNGSSIVMGTPQSNFNGQINNNGQ